MEKTFWKYLDDKRFISSFTLAVLFLAFALAINYYAGLYATRSASNPVTDIILDHIRVYDVDSLFIYGPMVFWIIGGITLYKNSSRLPFALKSIAFFILVRSFFMSLTHIGTFPTHVIIAPSILKIIFGITSGGDLFFSGHTGLPFLLALIFWDKIYLRLLFIAGSITFGVVVLLGHLHYSIDVLAAYFITYAIYHIASAVFKKDKELFDPTLRVEAETG